MDNIVLDGVVYVKAALVAKDFRYTADYVSQLCRAKKVKARLVGRAWYVNPDSLGLYKKELKQERKSKGASETKTTTSNDKISIKAVSGASVKEIEVKAPKSANKSVHVPVTVISPSSVRVVPPVLKSKTLKFTNNQASSSETVSKDPAYSEDNADLIPILSRKKSIMHTVRVEAADAKRMKIVKTEKPSSFSPTEIPSVSLSGNITVEDYEEDVPEIKKANSKDNFSNSGYENKDRSAASDGTKTAKKYEDKITLSDINSKKTTKINVITNDSPSEAIRKIASKKRKMGIRRLDDKKEIKSLVNNTKLTSAQNKSTDTIARKSLPSEIVLKKTLDTNQPSLLRSISPVGRDYVVSPIHVVYVVVFSVFMAVVILSASSVVSVSPQESSSTFVFNMKQITDILWDFLGV